jgi:predicted metal-dependent RNase
MKKRFIIRTDPSIRLSEDDTRNAINKILPKEILITVIFCDEATGEVILEVNNPEGITPEIFIKIATGILQKSSNLKSCNQFLEKLR